MQDADIHREATKGARTPKGDEVCCRGTLVSDDVGIVKAAAVLLPGSMGVAGPPASSTATSATHCRHLEMASGKR